MALLDQGWKGENLTIVEPSGKTSDDRTWSYWSKTSLLPTNVEQKSYSSIVIASDGKCVNYALGSYKYFSVRSSKFYDYGKQVLAKAGVTWLKQKVSSIVEREKDAEVILSDSKRIYAEYVLDSRPPKVEIPSSRYNATLQHFGGWFVKMPFAVFDIEEVVFMDFIKIPEGVAFFYVIPSTSTEALVEIAVFSESSWPQSGYDEKIGQYITQKYKRAPAEIIEKEYGVIPMTDEPLWKGSSERIWNIGTRGGWVQPSSGYAFTRTAKFATEVAQRLRLSSPKPWEPSSVQQVFNSVMLGYIIDNPHKAGSIFYDLFANNGPERTFDFMDEASSIGQTIRLMLTCPQVPFASRAIKETLSRLWGSK